jgi:hypothetical protein
MRNVLAHAASRTTVSSPPSSAPPAQNDVDAARTQWRQVGDQLRPRVGNLAAMMDDVETDVLAYMSFSATHRPELHSISPIERLNGEIKRRTDVGLIPRRDAGGRRAWPLSRWNNRDVRSGMDVLDLVQPSRRPNHQRSGFASLGRFTRGARVCRSGTLAAAAD